MVGQGHRGDSFHRSRFDTGSSQRRHTVVPSSLHHAVMEEPRLAPEPYVREHRSVRRRFGFRRGLDGLGKRRPLPAVSCLARELCAQRGLKVGSHGLLPSGGTIVSVDDLSFDVALVLLSLLDDARVYSDRAFAAAPNLVHALSLRSCQQLANAPMFESLVHDLSCGRVVVLSASHTHALTNSVVLRTRVRKMYVDVSTPSMVRLLSEV